MRLNIISVGKLSDSLLRDACGGYAERVQRYADLRLTVVREERVDSPGRIAYILREEGKRIREKLHPGGFSVALDERGPAQSSESFARSLEKWSHGGTRQIDFILGGPYGLDPDLKKNSDSLLSLSPMTFTHGMALLFLLEQIYRAFTILRGEPYHK